VGRVTQSELQSDRPQPLRVDYVFAGMVASLVIFGAVGCWAARPNAVAAPDFTSVRTRLDAAQTQRLEQEEEQERIEAAAAVYARTGDAVYWLPTAPTRDWRYIVLHHSGTQQGSVESIDADHRQRTDQNGQSWLGIGYHFVVGNGQQMPDGEITATFRWDQQLTGAHAGASQYNTAGIGICVIGDCDTSPPTDEQLKSLKKLVSVLSARYDIPKSALVPHSEVKPTSCPGRYFPLDEIAAGLPDAAETGAARNNYPLVRPRAAYLPALLAQHNLLAKHNGLSPPLQQRHD
jgi:hypothetical protein